MALQTLIGEEEINGHRIVSMDDLREKYPEKFNESGAMDWQWFEKEIRPSAFIYVRHDKNSVSFTLQNGPIKDNGINGCQVDDIIAVARLILEKLDKKVPNYHNQAAIAHLTDALKNLQQRRVDRESRGVEGTDQV